MRILQLSILLLLGCSSVSGATPTRPTPAHPGPIQDDPGATIRFGDRGDHVYGRALLPGGDYDPDLPTPDELLGQPWGSRIAGHDEILTALRTWVAASPRATLESYGRTHEGRELVFLVITSEENQARIERIRSGLASLSDPRELSADDAHALIDELPACAWAGYGIHGDEVSASDAAPLVAYHLIAGRDEAIERLLDDVVIVMDPCLNPDGRERIRAMTRWMSGYRTNLDHASLHRGRWPYGRGNHYLFDMNRDWMAGVCPETRGRWSVLARWRPQLFIDAHEMGSFDTFLFYPQEKPHHPELPARLIEWQGVFADAAGVAFDEHGWGYYTREWADAWYPGYSDAWGSLNGAVGMLYEQAGIGGQPMRRPSGVIETYAETVHGQVVASLANLETLRLHRAEILRDYLADRRTNVEPDGPWRDLVLGSKNAERVRRIVSALQAQGVEVFRATADFSATDVVSADGERVDERTFDHREVYVVPDGQPQRPLVHAYFDFDPRMDDETVRDERERLERGAGSRLYDVTAWDLARQTGLDAWWCTVGTVTLDPAAPPAVGGAIVGETEGPAYAWALDCTDDASLRFVARGLELGLAIHASDRAFAVRVVEGGEARDVALPRGSFLLRRHENPPEVDALVARATSETGTDVLATSTGRAHGATPDLGGNHFHLLHRPRVAMVTGESTSSEGFGHLWHHLDADLRMPVTLLEARDLAGYDLRPYDVLVLPPGFGLEVDESLTAWVRGGGTLIACGSSTEAVIAQDGLTAVVRRRDVLDDLAPYTLAAERQRAASDTLDLDALWGAASDATEGLPETGKDEGDAGLPNDLTRHDAWMRRFMPGGALLRAELDAHHWLTAGCGAELPVLFRGRTALHFDGRAPVRFAIEDRIRLGGLLWPEARERLAGAVWASQEGIGHGQVILFATNPVFRGTTRATARVFTNAVVLGPGLGADPPIGW